MKSKTYSIFGAGAAGLYTAWRLLSGETKSKIGKEKKLAKGDTLELYDWGKYDFSKAEPGTRAPGARVCTWHYKNDPKNSYLELGGMRYSKWDSNVKDTKNFTSPGHRLVTTVISQLGLDKYSVPFNESTNPLFYLRSKNMFLNDITSSNPAPYSVDHYGAATSPDNGFTIVENLSVTNTVGPQTRKQWDAFYQNGRITSELSDYSIFQKGDYLKDIGYWDLMYDQLGSEGFNYSADGNGYTSNVINWNAAVAFQANNEFSPGNQYNTLTTGYSGMFTALFEAIVKLCKQQGVHFNYYPNTRLHSILEKNKVIHYTFATRKNPWKKAGSKTTDAAWLAMPRYAIDQVAQATRFENNDGFDVLNHQKVQLYLESTIMQPSYKVGMFFDQPWWTAEVASPPAYIPQLTGYVVTPNVINELRKEKFNEKYLAAISGNPVIMNQPFASSSSLIEAVDQTIKERLTITQENQLLDASLRNTIGPSVTDTPARQVVYFGNNANEPSDKPVYGLLASYDDEQFTSFWEELELEPNQERKIPLSENVQPLDGPRKVPERMVKMLRRQLAEIHFGPNSNYTDVPMPLEARYMDWSLPPFNAGYHAWAAHYNIADVQQKIRKPSQLVSGKDLNLFIVGEAYSNDQAWVEGAYCTSESVLNDFFDIIPIIDNKNYPFICEPI